MKQLILVMLISLSWGCVKLPIPRPSAPERYLYGQGFSTDSLPYDIRWWQLFGDRRLDSLEERALRQNLDLAVAASRVEQARQNRRVTVGAYLPTLDAEVTASSDHEKGSGTTRTFAIEGQISWEVPLFGALTASRRAAQAEILQSEWAFRGVVLSLTAEVATSYFQLLSYERSYHIAEQTYYLRREAAALTDSMVRYGMKSQVASDQAQSLVATAAADRAQYARQVAQSRLSMQILLGEEPHEEAIGRWGTELFTDQLPEEIPVGLPSDLLARRPDVMEALFELDQAAANVGLARAARLPTLSLTVEGGVASNELKGLFRNEPAAWQIGGSLLQPIFAFGRLKAQEQVAREKYCEAMFSYRQSFLQALSDVEQALVGVTTYAEQVAHTRELVARNEAVARKTQALYENGMSAYLDVIDAERSYYESQQQLIELIAARYIAYINLFKALGGGW